ncbi:MAG TPA: O-antigen ligase family protein [Planctomycetota bacterium]
MERTWSPSRPRALAAWALLVPALALLAWAPLVALALAGLLACAWASLRRPALATCAALFLLYSNLPAVGVSHHGLPAAAAASFGVLLLPPLAHELLVHRRLLVLTPGFLLLLPFLGVQIVSAAGARDPARAFEAVTTFALEGLALYFLVTNVVRTPETLRAVLCALVAAGVLMSAVPILQQATGTFERDFGGLGQVDGPGFRTTDEDGAGAARQARLAGTVGETNRYAQVLLVLVPLGLALLLGARTPGARALAGGATAVITLGFLLAFSRGGAVGLVCLGLAMVALRWITPRRALLMLAGLGLLALCVPQYGRRLATLGESLQVLDREAGRTADGAVRRRATEVLAALRVFVDHPWVGVGPGLFKQYSEEYGNRDALRRIEGGRRAHSLFPEIAAETGALGLAAFLAALTATLAQLLRARRALLARAPGHPFADLLTACFLALVAYLTTGLFLHLAYMRYFWLLLALGGAAAAMAARVPGPRAVPSLAAGGAA